MGVINLAEKEEKKETKKEKEEIEAPEPPKEDKELLVVKELPTQEVRKVIGEDGVVYYLETREEALTKVRKDLEELKRLL